MKKLLGYGLAIVCYLLVVLLAVAPPRQAHASNCSPYPYTLSNGTTADANQVMADLNTIMTCANTSLAHNGVNSDITQFTSITTPLSVSQGGTGQSTSIFSTNNTWAGSQALATGTTSLAPLLFGSGGSLLASPTVGAFEWDGTNLYVTQTGPTRKALLMAGMQGVVQVRNAQSSGTGSGDSISNASWGTLILNTVATNTLTGASLSSNQVTLPAGTYEVRAVVPGSSSNSLSATGAGCRLFNATDSSVVIRGPSTGSNNVWAGGAVTGVFTLAGSKALAIQCRSAGAIVAVGAPISDGTSEVYTDVTFVKIG